MIPLKILFAAVLCASAAVPADESQNPNRYLHEAAEDPALKESLDALYKFDYARTRELGLEFIRRHPQNPFWNLFLAGALWWEAATETWYGPPPTTLMTEFDKQVDFTIEKSKKLIRSEDKRRRTDGYFAAGMVLGLKGQMKLARGKYFGAYRNGKKGMKYLKKCVKIDPEYYDAYMGLGIFDYQVAVLPGALRLGAKLLFRGTGDANRGIRRLRLAIDKGRFASSHAAAFLLTIYIQHERDYDRALSLTRHLLRDFPDSPYLLFVETALLNRTGDWPASYRSARALFERINHDPRIFSRNQLGTICGLAAAGCFDRSNLEGAARWITKALDASETEGEEVGQDWLAMLHLYRGLTLDILGKRSEAQADYGEAANLPDFGGTRVWGSFCWHRPCNTIDALALLKGRAPDPGTSFGLP
ncbi:MAG: hypothetical protein V3S11_06165 [Elusimicrobiota bacterium]